MSRVPKKNNIIYRLGHMLSTTVFTIAFPSEAYGVENVPQKGPFILACNHSSFLDPFVAGCFIKRDIHYFARRTLFKPGIANWFLRGFNAIPVDRDSGRDIKSIKTVFQLLKSGEALLMFPEGTRSTDDQLQPAKAGIGMIACKAQVPVVPARIFGAREAWGRNDKFPILGKKITVVYGKKLLPTAFDSGKDDPLRYQNSAARILTGISRIQRQGSGK